MTILVTGATGNVGRQVVRELRKRDELVRAFVRDAGRAATILGDEVVLAAGDFSDAASIRRALDGVDRVFLSSADGPLKVEHEAAVIDACAAFDVRRIVKVSTMLADPASPLPPLAWNGRIEEHLRRSAVPAVILRSGFYMTNLLASADQIRAAGRLFAPAGEGRVAMIDPRDTGSVGAALLTGNGHDGETVNVSGEDAITYRDVARDLSAATGRTIVFVDVPDDALRQGLVEAGMPDWLVEHLGGLFPLIRQGALSQTTDTVRALTGREPRSFADFAREHAALFGAVAAHAT
jgi:uncharacterized protein YbjT (DUF2867 family)